MTSSPPRHPRLLAALAAALLSSLTLPVAAHAAGSVSFDGTVVRVTEATPGERNTVTLGIQTVGVLEISDQGEIAIGAGCTRSDIDPMTALCPMPAGGVVVETGAGDDVVGSYVASGLAPLPDDALRVSLGDGNDTFNGNIMGEIVDGGPGNDTLKGGAGNDTLDGGAGDDTLDGGVGADVLHAGDGTDRLTGDDISDRGVHADVLDGGGGVDALTDYRAQGGESAAPPISVTLDGVANDGRAGEGDNVTAVEVFLPESPGTFVGDDGPNEWYAPAVAPRSSLNGAGGNDVLRGSDQHGDLIDGGPGDDDLSGGFGDDTLTGGPGRDIIAGDRPLRCNELHCDLGGGNGNDTIEARDGEVDSITCGAGTDRVVADAADVVAADCETVERPAGPADGGKPDDGGTPNDGGKPNDSGTTKLSVKLAGQTRLKGALAKGLRVAVVGAKPAAKVKVTLTLGAPTARKLGLTKGKRAVTVASGSAKATSAGKASVRATFTKVARKRLARAKRVTLTLRTGTASRTVVLKR